MRVIYSGGTVCRFETLQRLILLADEIGFMDRPSVTFGNFGTIGFQSEFRRFKVDSTPIGFSVFTPPSGPASELYRRYVDADLQDPTFIRTVLDGIKADAVFRSRVIQPEANYGWGTGQQIVDALVADDSLYEGAYSVEHDPKLMYVPDTQDGRRQTLGALLREASIHTTNALLVAEATELTPVSDDPYFCRLLALRTADAQYVAKSVSLASVLGLEIAKAVLPDESLSRLKISDLFEFRRSAKDQYAAWSSEIERLSLRLSDVPPDRLNVESAKLILTDVQPRMDQLRRDLANARDKLFGDLMKGVTRWEVPTLSLSYLAGITLPGALGAFAGALVPAVPTLVDYFVQRRALFRGNSMAYLVGLSNLAEP